MHAYREFELDLKRALLEHLPPILDGLQAATLTQQNVALLPKAAQGVYMLLYMGHPMYVGKTDATHGFQDRLGRHFFTLSARQKLDVVNVSFKAVRIMVFTTVNVESTLIEHYLGANPMAWQNSGFGSNDPGHNRETQEPSEFDRAYPISIDIPTDVFSPGSYPALDVLLELKTHLPYDFRFQADRHWRKGHVDHRAARLDIPRTAMTVRELFVETILPALPYGWVVTVFPGRLILYKEPAAYRYALEAFGR